ncbi:MAG: hypothetical protein MUC93_01295 [Bacteroidales bacterium]|jgi:hypothetical protein|nr:hypothetical protein [Bacteroidales bacterium]
MHYKTIKAILVFLVLTPMVQGQSFSEKRTFRKSLSVNKDMTLEVNNKYGTIQIIPWIKDSVSIRAEVEANSSNMERLHKMFNGVDINISETSFLLRAKTEFTENISMLFESFKGMTSKLIPYESRLEINYFISAPEYLNMRIINKYGDVYMEDNTGSFSLNLSNGSFKANSLNETDEITLTFCDATINKMKDGYINASFSEVQIGESRDLSITSISSHFDLKNTGKLGTESKRDKFFIGRVISLRGSSYFTDYRIDEIEKEINVITKYGRLNADLVGKNLEMITINSGYSDINLTFDPSLSYNLDIRHVNAFLVVPENNSRIEKRILNEEKKEYLTSGAVGKNPGNIKVMIDATRGNIYVK